MGQLKEAELYYRELIHRNPENYCYFAKLEQCLELGKLAFGSSY